MKKIINTFIFFLIALVTSGQKIYLTSNLSLQPIVEGGAVVKLSVALGDNAPSGNVTVSFSSRNGYFNAPGNLTFTSVNYAVPQSVNLTATNNSIDDGVRTDYLTIVASGGGYNTTKLARVTISDAEIDSAFLRGYANYSLNITTASTTRAALIAEIFNGGGLPSRAIPDSTTIGYTGAIHQTLTSALTGCTVDKLVFNETDNQGYVWSNKVYHVKKTGGARSKISFVVGGHGSELYHKEMIQAFIDADVDVLYVAMPSTQQNTETNPNINGIGVNAHNDMRTGGLDNGTYNPQHLFFFDKIMALNYIAANYSYINYYTAGCSGGGWTSIMLAALDTRISKSFDVRGFTPWHYVSVAANSDWEQGPIIVKTTFVVGDGNTSPQQTINYTAINYFDLCILASSGGRELYMIHHYDDSCCHGTFVYNLFFNRLKADAALYGGSVYLNLLTDPAYATHAFNVPDRAYIISKI